MELKPIIRKIYLNADKPYDPLYLGQYNKKLPVVFSLFNADGSKHNITDGEIVHIEISINETSIFKITNIEHLNNTISTVFEREIMLEDGEGTMNIYVSDGETTIGSNPIPIVIDAGAIDEDLNPKISALLISDLQDYITEAQQTNEDLKDTVNSTKEEVDTIKEATSQAIAENNKLSTRISSAKVLDTSLESKINTGTPLNANLADNITKANTAKPALDTSIEEANTTLEKLQSEIVKASLSSYVLKSQLVDILYPVGSIIFLNTTANPNDIFPNTSWSKVEGYLAGSGANFDFGSEVGSMEHTHGSTGMRALIGNINNDTGAFGYARTAIQDGMTEKYIMGFQTIRGIPQANISKVNHACALWGNTDEASSLPPTTVVNIWERIPTTDVPKISSFTAEPTSTTAGNTVTFRTVASGTGSLQYKYVIKGKTSNYSIVRDYNTLVAFQWSPKIQDDYECYVDVKDSNGVVTRSRIINYTVEAGVPTTQPIKISSFTADPKSPQVKGNTINLICVAKDGVGQLQYKFLQFDKAKNLWTKIRDFGESNTIAWTPTEIGVYDLYVDVKDSDDNVLRKSILDYVITEPVADLKVELTADKESPQVKGTKLTLTAVATGGAGQLQYKFLVQDVATNSWAVIKDYSSLDTIVWTASKAGTKNIYVDVRDSAGTTVRKSMSYNILSTESTAPVISSFEADKASPQVIGTPITLTATVTGNGNLQYKFVVQDSDGKWYLLRDFSTSNSYIWTPDIAGNKTLYVIVKDGNGNEATTSMSYIISENEEETVETNYIIDDDGNPITDENDNNITY